MSYRKLYEEWITNSCFDEETKAELKSISEDENEIKERFYKELEFGTAGLRGIIGAGINRMNVYTVRKATQGLANYILKVGGAEKGVVIAFDSRRMSPEFADVAALCLAANGIKAYRFESLRPTPELSFAVRELGCIAGINITASHNPPEYNGYKVYWEDGAQITPPHDTGIMSEVKAVTDFSSLKTMDMEEAKAKGLYVVIGAEVDDKYMAELKKQVKRQDLIDKVKKDLKIVYTPLHGTGLVPVTTVLKELGFENVYVVEEQAKPDGRFPTVKYPNPEEDSAFELAISLAKEKDADIVMATDPDADRLGLFVKVEPGRYISFNGNMIGTIIAEYILRERKNNKTLPLNAAVVSTIVTTDMVKAVCERYGVKLIETLTGFKYVGEQIKFFEKDNSYEFVFGLEESYGCLAGTYARDKDACSTLTLLCEVAAYYKTRGMTLWDGMQELYDFYGAYAEKLSYIVLQGKDGLAKIVEIMTKLRREPLDNIGEFKIYAVTDYITGERVDYKSGIVSRVDLPKSDVLYYELDGGAWCAVRPSGTEPKIKFYMGTKAQSFECAMELCEKLSDALVAMGE